jgi:hypothetical protein
MLSKSMLTLDTLTRFEKEADVNLLSNEAKRKIEHYAYCANIGAESKEAAWNWFRHLVNNNLQISVSASPHP